MHTCGVLGPESHVILSHANHMAAGDMELVQQNGVYISSTPSVELQMGLGTPACFDHAGKLRSRSSLGIDCHNATIASIVNEMRCALVQSRGAYNGRFLAAGKMNAKINRTVQEAYALGTIQGARAVGMESEIGSLAVGKKADIIIFDALAPSMICAAQYDPVTAIVMHSAPGDISMVFVDGVLRKAHGKILPVQLDPVDLATADVSDTHISWEGIGKNLLSTQKTLQAKIERLDLQAVKQTACASFGMDPAMIAVEL